MEETDDLPSEFDVVVVGTGMVESIVAASAARIGKTVLHLDRNTYYGDLWATIGLEAIEDFAKSYCESEPVGVYKADTSSVPDGCKLHPTSSSNVIDNFVYKWFIPMSKPEVEDVDSNNEKVDGSSLSQQGSQEIPSNRAEDENTNGDSSPKQEQSDGSAGALDGNVTEYSEEQGYGNCDRNVEAQEENTNGDDAATSQEETFGGSVANEKNDKTKQKFKDPYDWTIQKLKEQSRKFNVDLSPKVIYSTGAMVELLLKSCVHRYTEFQSVSQILALVSGSSSANRSKLERVPCTKSDVFSSRNVSPIDKRILMKILNFCLNFNESSPEYDELKDQLFIDYLSRERVPAHLVQYILYSIATSTRRTRFFQAAVRIQAFLKNVGRYGNSPFLWPLYGSGELLQAFCRLSAVYGGVYYLGRGANAIVSKDNICTGILSRNKYIKCSHVVTSCFFCPSEFLQGSTNAHHISRTILFTDRPLYPSDKEAITLLHFPPKDESALSPILLVELPSISGSCPNGMYVVHITYLENKEDSSEVRDLMDVLFTKKSLQSCDESPQTDSLPQDLLNNLKDDRFKEWLTQKQNEGDIAGTTDESNDKPQILYALHFRMKSSADFNFSPDKPDNFHLCLGPDSSLDFDVHVKQAKEIFTKMFPTEEFLEPTPDPNEITLSDLMGNNSTDQEDQNEKGDVASEAQPPGASDSTSSCNPGSEETTALVSAENQLSSE